MIDINTDIKIAIAGCGSAGRNHIRIFSAMDEVEITACCDSDEELAEFTAREFGIASFYGDFAQMLESAAVDAVVIALPDAEHIDASLEALRTGVNVLCETPLAPGYAEAVELTRAARESELVAMVNFESRNNALIAAASKAVEAGRIGRVKYFEAALMQNRFDQRILDDPREEKRLLWRLSSAAGSAGAVGELGSFLYDAATVFCGDVSGISARISNISGFDEVEEYQELELTAGDTFSSQLSFKSGAAGLIRGSWASSGAHEHLSVSLHGELGMISIDTSRSSDECFLFTSSGEDRLKAAEEASDSVQENFVSAIRGEAAPRTSFDEALRIQYYIEQSRLSNDAGLNLELSSEDESV